MARSWAERLGTIAGVEAVETFAIDARVQNPTANVAKLLHETLSPGVESWDMGARDVDAAGMDGCPKGYEETYYVAYELAACREAHDRSRIEAIVYGWA